MSKKQKIKRKRGYYHIQSGTEELVRPAVTHVIGKTLAKPSLAYWRGSVGNEEASRISMRARDFGSDMHSVVAKYLKNYNIPLFKTESMLSEEKAEAWRIWEDWWKDNKIEPSLVEETIYNGDYAGTCDLAGFDEDGKCGLIDWKFSSGIYDSHKIQAGAYANIINADWAKIVRIKDKTIEVCDLSKEELEENAEVFYALLHVFNWKEK